jgi:hypothetical protein
MQTQQLKRLYNVAFALTAISSCLYLLGVTKSFLETNVIEAQKEKHEKMFRRQREFIYNQILKSGNAEEAARFRNDQQASFFAVVLSNDENGKPFGPQERAIDDRIKFLETNHTAISVATLIVFYLVSYFALWYLGYFLAHYVKGQPKESPPTTGS